MKKYVLLLIMVLIFVAGCGNRNLESVKEEFVKNTENRTSYLMKGSMTIISNEDTFTYNITAARDNDNYRVTLVNQLNDHEQIILRSNDEVYVVTPSLNKSFKFQSEWPDNGSQAYLLDSLANDVKNDAEAKVERSDNGYMITAKVNYPNNANLVNERIHLDEDGEVLKVEVLDATGNVKITVLFQSIDFSPSFEDDYFKLESLIDEECCEHDETVNGIIEDIIYPLYLPVNTYLATTNSVNTENGNRVILTFAGESPFTLIEEVARARTEFEIIPVFGEPLMLSDTIGALSANSLSWTSNNITYHITSDRLSSTELLTIANSMSKSSIPVSGTK